MNLSKRLELVNTGRFLVYCCILVFVFLISLWSDGLIRWSIWTVFLPLWLWKMTLMFGAAIGIGMWCHKPEARFERSHFIQFRAMIISTSLHLLLILFEILVCIRIESGSDRFPWTLVFAPLMFTSILAIILCLWAIKNERGFEMEMIFSVNSIQFVFIAIKLDGFINWSWLLVLIPLWAALSVAFIFMLYAVIVALILMRNSDAQPEHRHITVNTAISYVFIVVPLIVYAVLLVEKLEGMTLAPYTLLGIPLYISIITLIISSFSSRPGNIWWFGLRKDFCQFLVSDACPCLQEYGNISYKVQFNECSQSDSTTEPISQQPTSAGSELESHPSTSAPSPTRSPHRKHKKSSSKDALVAPVVFIEMPD